MHPLWKAIPLIRPLCHCSRGGLINGGGGGGGGGGGNYCIIFLIGRKLASLYSGADPGGGAHPARAPPKIGKNKIFWR